MEKNKLSVKYPELSDKIRPYATTPTPAVYKLYIGKYFYIGKTMDIYNRIHIHISKMVGGYHNSPEVQKVFNENPEAKISVIFRTFPDVRHIDELTRREDLQILDNKDSKYILNQITSMGGINEHVSAELTKKRSVSSTKSLKRFWDGLSSTERDVFNKQRTIKSNRTYRAKSKTERKEIIDKRATSNKATWKNKDRQAFANMVKENWAKKTPEERRIGILHLCKSVICEGCEYGSISEAAKAFDISVNAMKHRLNSTSAKWKNFKFK